MIKQCRAQGAVEPEFVLIRNVEFRVILARDIYTESFLNKIGLNDRQLNAVKYIKQNGQINNQTYQKINNTTKRTTTRDLSNLVAKGILKKYGTTGKGTLYLLKGTYRGQRGHNVN